MSNKAGVLGKVQTDMRVLGPYLNVELGMKGEVLNRIRAAKHAWRKMGQTWFEDIGK